MESKYTPEQVKSECLRWLSLKSEIGNFIVGQEKVVERILLGILCGGHMLLEGVPGLAKTTLVKTVADSIGLAFSRIQFTPDLLPADLIGTLVYNPQTREFQTRKGPIFASVVLADEVNRAPAKVQSALLEAMQELQVTIGGDSFELPRPFLVLATQNPIDQEGTYRLPEAQVDRFMFKVVLGYPSPEEEIQIMNCVFSGRQPNKIMSEDDISLGRDIVNNLYIDEKVIDYIVRIVFATRDPESYKLDIKNLIEYGASPRASIALNHASRAHAFINKRHFVIPEDVRAVAPDVLRHRIILSYEAEAEEISTDTVIKRVLSAVPSP